MVRMIAKSKERDLAISLRKEGLSLREIRTRVPVAKSTLSVWFKEVHLSRPQKQRLTQKRLDAAMRGAMKRKSDRITATELIYQEAGRDIGAISDRELWLMGIMLYWAEGAKQKEYSPSNSLKFSNSDPAMIRLFVKWLNEICEIPLDSLRFDVYIHETARRTREELFSYWAKKINVPVSLFKGLYFKKGNIKTKRKNTNEGYFGLVSLRVYRSTAFNRKITGWVQGICKTIH